MYKLSIFINDDKLNQIYLDLVKLISKEIEIVALDSNIPVVFLEYSNVNKITVVINSDKNPLLQFFKERYKQDSNVEVKSIENLFNQPNILLIRLSKDVNKETLASIIKHFNELITKKVTSKIEDTSVVKYKNDKEKRIVEIYQMVLGRSPNPNDLAFLNTVNITDQDLIVKMVESQEHLNLVLSRQEVLESRVQYNVITKQNENLSKSIKDKTEIIESMGLLNEQKNSKIEELKKRLDLLTNEQRDIQQTLEETDRRGFSDKILDFFNKYFG